LKTDQRDFFAFFDTNFYPPTVISAMHRDWGVPSKGTFIVSCKTFFCFKHSLHQVKLADVAGKWF